MKLAGVKLDNVSCESSHRVIEAVVTSERIALDWLENGVKYHLLARSQNGGLTYHGTYGMFRPEDDWVVEITRYAALDGSVVLFCEWHEKGLWASRLVDVQVGTEQDLRQKFLGGRTTPDRV